MVKVLFWVLFWAVALLAVPAVVGVGLLVLAYMAFKR